VAGPGSEAWPEPIELRVRQAPDWSDYRLYPPVARRRELEGVVTVETRVGADGTPRACRILGSSGHVELDDGTCDLALRMRFAPPRRPDGTAAEAAYRARISWLLADPTTFGPGRFTIALDVAGGLVTGCRTERSDAVPREWPRYACRVMDSTVSHYFGDSLATARRATILLDLVPRGMEPPAPAPPGRLVARRRTEFEVTRGGKLRNCRTTLDEGFAPLLRDHSGPCSLFLTRAWLRRGKGRDAPDAGALITRTYVETAP
jgi:TonB family protein